MRVEVKLPKDRLSLGTLQAFDDAGTLAMGPVKCLGKADNRTAKEAGNEKRDPLHPFGDTPSGKYAISGLRTHHNGESDAHTYGTYPSVGLDPIAGDALQAKKNGRSGLLIHGGAPNASGSLRPTQGCIRLSENDQRDLVAIVVGSILASSTVVVTDI